MAAGTGGSCAFPTMTPFALLRRCFALTLLIMFDPTLRPSARLAQWLRVIALCLVSAVPLRAQTLPEEAPPFDPRAALIEILRDEASRDALIAELERSAPELAAEPEAAPVPVVQRIADATRSAASRATANAAALWNALQGAPDILSGIGPREVGIVVDAVRDLLLAIASTVGAFVVLRLIARGVLLHMGRRSRAATALGRVLILLGAVVVDAAVVLLAWGIGYGLAATLIGQFGEVAMRQSLYLNAFLLVELAKVLARRAISPGTRDLRLMPVSDAGAVGLYRVLNIAISIVGYGLLLVAPIITANASVAAGNSASTVVILSAAIYLGIACLRRRKRVADWLLAQGRMPVPRHETPIAAADPQDPPEPAPLGARPERQPRRQGLYGLLARNWHILAILWLAFVVLTALTRPVSAIIGLLQASVIVAVAIVTGLVLSGMLGRGIGRTLHLPQGVTRNLPRLEDRLNGFVPQILIGLRMALLLAIALLIADVTGIFDTGHWLQTPAGLAILGTLLSVLAILAVAFALWLALTSWVEFRLNPEVGHIPTARERTLLTLLRNALTIALLVITLMFALSEIGLDIGPLLASAGVLGLAVGFGAQKLVQDVITGVFIQFENAMNVGDVVTAGPVTGVVEKLTIRSVSLRDLHGVYHLIPFSSVESVSNFMRDFSYFVIDMGVAYRENLDEVREAMFDAYEELRGDAEQGVHLLGDLEWLGLDRFGDSAIVLRARIKTLPGKQWGVGRAYNGIIKRIFDERGIEIPFPHTTLFFGEDKRGETQSLRVTAGGPALPADG